MQSSNPDQNQKETPSTSSAPEKIVELIVDKLASGMSHFQVEIAETPTEDSAPHSTADADMPSSTADVEMASTSYPPKRPKLDSEHCKTPANLQRPGISVTCYEFDPAKRQLEELQRAREVTFKRGSGVMFEFWANKHDFDMNFLIKSTQCCSYLYHLNRKYVYKLQNLRCEDFLKDPTKPFLVRDFDFPPLTILGCNGADLCLDKVPWTLDQQHIDNCYGHLESFNLPDAEDEQTIVKHLAIIRKDYVTTMNKRATFLVVAQDSGLICRTCIPFDKFYESVEPVLGKFGFSSSKFVGDLREIEVTSSINSAFVFHEPYIQALFKVLLKQGLIHTHLKEFSPFWLHLGHFSEGPYCCHTNLSKLP